MKNNDGLFLIFKMLTCLLHLPHRLFSVSAIMVEIKNTKFGYKLDCSLKLHLLLKK